jgi:NADH-quinone oxidoreductase subunit J
MINVLSHGLFFLLGFSSLCVVFLQNTFFALLFLVFSFVLTSIILFFLECEFLALMLIIIYVGAVAVLLLFVLMMLETKLKSLSKDIVKYFPFGVFISGVFFFQFVTLISNSFSSNSYFQSVSLNSYSNWYQGLDSVTDLEVYGQLLYTQFIFQVLIVGLILFLALVGVIFLTKSTNAKFKPQTSFCQLSRSYIEQNPSQILLK